MQRAVGLTLVGPFPPPVTGAAMVQASVARLLEEAGMRVLTINLAPVRMERSIVARLGRVPAAVQGLVRLIRAGESRGESLYVALSGGIGQLYELGFAVLGRLRGMRIVLHHHSYAYIDRRSHLTALLARVAGGHAVHVCLSENMRARLERVYAVGSATVVSNALFAEPAPGRHGTRAPGTRPGTLGFLSNISREKGIDEFIGLYEACRAEGFELNAQVAGPFQNRKEADRIRALLDATPGMEYLGPKYGEEKLRFFDSVDVFVFPTRYSNEADPLVIHEALARGIPVIAYGRGCIPEVLAGSECLAVSPALPFIPPALARIAAWLAEPAQFEQACRGARARFEELHAAGCGAWRRLLAEINKSRDARG